MKNFFGKWTNKIIPVVGVNVFIGLVLTVLLVSFFASPSHTDVGFNPEQPIPFSHKTHAGDYKIDCRYCHENVERSKHATVPRTKVCLSCHDNGGVAQDSEALQVLRDVNDSSSPFYEKPIQWQRVHKLPEYAYFDHSVHVSKGVACISCHGDVTKMDTAVQKKPLSMSWCLDCHKDVPNNIVPHDYITRMDFPKNKEEEAELEAFRKAEIAEKKNYNFLQECSTCHR